MEVTALCIRLLLNVLMLLLDEQVQLSFAQQAYAAWIVPTRLQLFDYSPITFNCEGFNTTTGWRVMRNKKGKVSMCFSNWETATPSICAIKTVYPTDSGEYWCETVDGEKSNIVNVTVTAGPVILESPAVPVMEGKAVTLHCRSKTSSVHIADFYKDGLLLGTGPVGELTISSVSKSNEGLYKCRISDFGESPESWLAVRDAAFVHIVPSRLQFFEHEFVFIYCDGFFNDLTKWRVMKKIKETTTTCKRKLETPGPCNITTAFSFDSGEYWCEAEGKKSNVVDITVTDGPVILESPALPVTEGDNVILRCRNKTTSNLKADFYKDGLLIKNTTTAEMIIHGVSKSDEGLYRCNIPEAGKSAESWLAVRAHQGGIAVSIVVAILLVTVLLLLLMMGLNYMKCKVLTVLVLLLSAQVQHSDCHKADASFPRIVPSRLQFFEYESLFINCDEMSTFNKLTEWRVMRKFDDKKTICNVKWEKTGSCNITSTFTGDSGEYWCQAEGKTSSIVNIVVTAGPVILESPASPVMEGDDVTLRCRNKTTSNLKAYFYKDGVLIRSSSTGHVTIRSVSQSDEGHYKCNISGAGESAESWLAVTDMPVILESPRLPVVEGNNITLHCRGRNTVNAIVHFYKDGILIRNSTARNMTIHSISKSHEGLYKCHISGVGESDETLVAVTDDRDNLFAQVCTLISIVIAVFLLLLVMGLYHWYKDTSEAQLQQATDVDVTTQEPINRKGH
ncbi:Fc receptor-like protein 5 [Collichthys lucidus]|uniref:Fc receptor-like protein 5 n=1 Tax=Collichthys lucidus TaxID=240159 RepID=A0A4U5VX02_COLLU|nr:Fc receptor-like protein 5 [Collichthys lucidus]